MLSRSLAAKDMADGLRSYRDCFSTDPRDKLFAFLACMSNATRNLYTPVDYSRSVKAGVAFSVHFETAVRNILQLDNVPVPELEMLHRLVDLVVHYFFYQLVAIAVSAACASL
jgi:hypothetical protein